MSSSVEATTDSAPASKRARTDDLPHHFPLLPITSERTVAAAGSLKCEKTCFIASYPKSGTTWLQNVVWQLIAASGDAPALKHISDFAPFLEADRSWDHSGATSALADPAASFHSKVGRLRAFNTHLLHSMLPRGPAAKILYVTRSPADVVTSFWHHLSHQSVEDGGYSGEIGGFVDEFLRGDLPYGAWRLQVGSWLAAAKDDERVLVLSYEELKSDLLAAVRRIAEHLNLSVSEETLRETVLPRLSVEDMKANLATFEPKSVRWTDKGDGFTFVRKGEMGDSVNLLSAEQLRAIEQACWEPRDVYSPLLDALRERSMAALPVP